MDEGNHTEGYLQSIEEAAKASGLELEFNLIQGPEAEVLAGMQSCEVFLSMNTGKDPLWGEGCPRTAIEALSTGCVAIAFDIIGNREIIQNNFNGILVPRYRPDLMANALISLYREPAEIDRLRDNAESIIRACHTLESRWPAVRDFLELPNG
jgi:glycosyltransferase involved in cell wall biosynthesis